MAQRILLIVDDEENILRALVRLLRRDGYTLLTAGSGAQGLELLAQHPVGVILSDQRMPGMMGTEFLERAKEARPDTVRIMLSGYTDLQSVTEAINRGAIYRFLTKPWDDDLLRDNIRQAFEHHELRAERDRLARELQAANEQLATSNQGLERQIASQSRTLDQNQRLLELSREVLERLPVGVVGVSDDGKVAVANSLAHRLVGQPSGALLEQEAEDVLPASLQEICHLMEHETTFERHHVSLGTAGGPLTVHGTRLGAASGCHGNVLVLVPEQAGNESGEQSNG
jgi:response regulator RpfG family c-di-GMP phosphodiesterase